MPSHKQKRDRKRSHKHKHRNRSRSPLRRRNAQRKNEGKKENIPHNSCSINADNLRDMSSYMENRKEMIRQMFAAVGEDFLAKNTPTILEKVSNEELRKICYEELSKMSNDVIFKILEGIPCDGEEVSSAAECTSSISCGGHTPAASPQKESSRVNEGCEEPKSEPGSSKEDDGNSSCEELLLDTKRSELLDSSSCEESPKKSGKDVCKGSDDESTQQEKFEGASTSCYPLMTKKLAKVAPFVINNDELENELPSSAKNDNERLASSDTDNESDCEIVDLGLEESLDDLENDSDAPEEKPMDKAPPDISALDENSDLNEVSDEEMQQNLSEVLELEHRARAIRSMLENMDTFQA